MKKLAKSLKRISSHKGLLFYIALVVTELKVVGHLSDLHHETQGWIPKSEQLLHLQIPTDNFYGPGSAILMVPFAIFKGTACLSNYFYLVLGSSAYWKLSNFIQAPRIRLIALAAIPCNFYLIWLIDSSQDTVFEFALLSWSVLFLVERRIAWFIFITFLLCETRSGYWVYFLGISIIFLVRELILHRKFAFKWLTVFILLFITSSFNYFNYSSPSPALEGGITAYFSYTKYHYLALPKMDMDVFLSGPNGAFSSNNGPVIPAGSSEAEVNSIYQKAAIASALSNKKETVLGWMQKFDSYLFDVQKIPHLPGTYVLNQDNKTITILDERLSWHIVVGNLLFEIYRAILLLALLLGLGIVFGYWLIQDKKFIQSLKLPILVTPFVFGLIPGILIYTETRFKIVSELILVPFVAEIWALAILNRTKKQITD